MQSHGSTNTVTACHIKLSGYLNIVPIYYYFPAAYKPYNRLENLNYFCRLGTVELLPKMQYLTVIHPTYDIDISQFITTGRNEVTTLKSTTE